MRDLRWNMPVEKYNLVEYNIFLLHNFDTYRRVLISHVWYKGKTIKTERSTFPIPFIALPANFCSRTGPSDRSSQTVPSHRLGIQLCNDFGGKISDGIVFIRPPIHIYPSRTQIDRRSRKPNRWSVGSLANLPIQHNIVFTLCPLSQFYASCYLFFSLTIKSKLLIREDTYRR